MSRNRSSHLGTDVDRSRGPRANAPPFWSGLRKLLILAVPLWFLGCGEEGADHSLDSVSGPPPMAVVADDGPCTLRLTPSGVTLRSDLEGSVPDPGHYLAIDSQGRYFTTTFGPGEIAVWDRDGEFVELVGRHGQGPREFGHIGGLLMGPGDTLHVIHEGRWSTVSPELRVEHEATAPALRAAGLYSTVLADGRLVVGGYLSGTGEYLLHVVGRDGSVEASFGPRSGDWPAGTMPPFTAYAGTGTDFWAGPVHWDPEGYTLERFDATGERLDRMRLTVDWMIRPVTLEDGRYLPTLGIRQHSEGILLLKAALPASVSDSERVEPVRFKSRFEFIDARDRRVLSSVLLEARPEAQDNMIHGILPNTGKAFRYGVSEEGVREVQIIDLELVGDTIDGGEPCPVTD